MSVAADVDRGTALRALALGAVGLVTYSYVRVLYYVASVVGDPLALVGVVVASALAGVVVGRFVGPRLAFSVGLLLGLAGGTAYLLSLPSGWELVPLLSAMLRDSLGHLMGVSVLQLIRLDVWVLGFAPGPVFLTWYFATRRWYGAASLAGGLTLGLFLLTGDADQGAALLGLVAGAAAIGLGELERHRGTWRQLDVLAVVLAVVVVLTMLAPVGAYAASDGSYLGGSGGGGGGSNTVTAAAGERVEAVGSISLSTLPTFNVTSEERHYWRVDGYDRYTGDGWVRTGGTRPYSGAYGGPLDAPPGESHRLEQRFTARRYISAMPAAPFPVAVGGGVEENASVTLTGGLQHQSLLEPGDTYTVTSSVSDATTADLRAAGTDYPDRVRTRYTQVSAGTPDRVAELAANVTANASTPYERAVRIEAWLEENKAYSQNIRSPTGDMVDWFLFEADQGYCVYYASAMTVMLRTQGVPARFVLGYTPGEQIGDDRYLVRGLDSHAWVEVYFPDVGWVKFDPTPAAPRRAAERQMLERAQASQGPITPLEPNQTPTPEPTTTTPGDNDSDSSDPLNGTTPPSGGDGVDLDWSWGWLPDVPQLTREQLALLGVALGGLLAAVHYTGRFERLRLTAGLLWQGRQETPRAHVERAFERLERFLTVRYRGRFPGETPREYLSALSSEPGVDERVQRVGDLYERAHYAERASEQEATEAVELVDDVIGETPYGRFLWR